MNNFHMREGKVEFRWKRWRNKKRQEVSSCLMVLFSGAVLLGAGGVALAGPTGGQITGGTGTITTPNGTTTNINQQSNVLNINWQDFSIGAGETVNFYQPGATSIAINRVVGGVPSYLAGALNANGRVFILNSAGITFTGTSQVNVGALLATTAMTVNGDPTQAASYSGSGYGAVINQGSISVSNGGFAILAAPYVQNTGFIKADLGTIALAGTNQFTLDLSGTGLINFVVPASAVEKIVSDGKAVGVDNSGTLQARSGQVVISANVASEVVNAVVNLNGIVDADAFAANGQGGAVLVTAAGDINVGGQVTAKGSGAGAGGQIVTKAGGADAIGALAYVSAAGGAAGGKGGFIEVSGKQVGLAGAIDPGSGGSMFIDPTNIIVIAGTNGGLVGSHIGSDFIENQLAHNINVTLQAAINVEFQPLADDHQLVGGNGNFTVTAGTGEAGNIIFLGTNDAIVQGGGFIHMNANGGDIGASDGVGGHAINLRTGVNTGLPFTNAGVGVSQAGDIVLKAGHDIDVKNVTVKSSGGSAFHALFSASAGNNFNATGDINVQARAHGLTQQTADATVNIFAGNNISLHNVTVTALATENGLGANSAEASANLKLDALGGNIGVTGNIVEHASAAAAGTNQATANAQANLFANNNIDVGGNVVVGALANENNNATASGANAAANLQVDALHGHVNVGGDIGVGANAHSGHSSASANAQANVFANTDITVNGNVEVTASANELNLDGSSAFACANLQLDALTGNVTVNHDIAVQAIAHSSGGSDASANAKANIFANNNITVGGNVGVTALASGDNSTGEGAIANANLQMDALTGAVNVQHDILVNAVAHSSASTASANAKANIFANTNITVNGNVEVTASANEPSRNGSSAFACANLQLDALTGNVTVNHDIAVQACAFSSGPSDASANAKANIFANNNITVGGNVEVTALASGHSHSGEGAVANANLQMDALTGAVNVQHDILVNAVAHSSASTASANAKANIFANTNITVNGNVEVTASANEVGQNASSAFACANLQMDALTGNVTVNHDIAVQACAFSSGPSDATANAQANIFANNNITVGGNVEVTALANINNSDGEGANALANLQMDALTGAVNVQHGILVNAVANSSGSTAYANAQANVFANTDITVNGNVDVTASANEGTAHASSATACANLQMDALTGNVTVNHNIAVQAFAHSSGPSEATANAQANITANHNILIGGNVEVTASADQKGVSGSTAKATANLLMNALHGNIDVNGGITVTANALASGDSRALANAQINLFAGSTINISGNVDAFADANQNGPNGSSAHACANVNLHPTGDVNVHGGVLASANAFSKGSESAVANAAVHINTVGDITVNGVVTANAHAVADSTDAIGPNNGALALASIDVNGDPVILGGVDEHATATSHGDVNKANALANALVHGNSNLSILGDVTVVAKALDDSVASGKGALANAHLVLCAFDGVTSSQNLFVGGNVNVFASANDLAHNAGANALASASIYGRHRVLTNSSEDIVVTAVSHVAGIGAATDALAKAKLTVTVPVGNASLGGVTVNALAVGDGIASANRVQATASFSGAEQNLIVAGATRIDAKASGSHDKFVNPMQAHAILTAHPHHVASFEGGISVSATANGTGSPAGPGIVEALACVVITASNTIDIDGHFNVFAHAHGANAVAVDATANASLNAASAALNVPNIDISGSAHIRATASGTHLRAFSGMNALAHLIANGQAETFDNITVTALANGSIHNDFASANANLHALNNLTIDSNVTVTANAIDRNVNGSVGAFGDIALANFTAHAGTQLKISSNVDVTASAEDFANAGNANALACVSLTAGGGSSNAVQLDDVTVKANALDHNGVGLTLANAQVLISASNVTQGGVQMGSLDVTASANEVAGSANAHASALANAMINAHNTASASGHNVLVTANAFDGSAANANANLTVTAGHVLLGSDSEFLDLGGPIGARALAVANGAIAKAKALANVNITAATGNASIFGTLEGIANASYAHVGGNALANTIASGLVNVSAADNIVVEEINIQAIADNHANKSAQALASLHLNAGGSIQLEDKQTVAATADNFSANGASGGGATGALASAHAHFNGTTIVAPESSQSIDVRAHALNAGHNAAKAVGTVDFGSATMVNIDGITLDVLSSETRVNDNGIGASANAVLTQTNGAVHWIIRDHGLNVQAVAHSHGNAFANAHASINILQNTIEINGPVTVNAEADAGSNAVLGAQAVANLFLNASVGGLSVGEGSDGTRGSIFVRANAHNLGHNHANALADVGLRANSAGFEAIYTENVVVEALAFDNQANGAADTKANAQFLASAVHGGVSVESLTVLACADLAHGTAGGGAHAIANAAVTGNSFASAEGGIAVVALALDPGGAYACATADLLFSANGVFIGHTTNEQQLFSSGTTHINLSANYGVLVGAVALFSNSGGAGHAQADANANIVADVAAVTIDGAADVAAIAVDQGGVSANADADLQVNGNTFVNIHSGSLHLKIANDSGTFASLSVEEGIFVAAAAIDTGNGHVDAGADASIQANVNNISVGGIDEFALGFANNGTHANAQAHLLVNAGSNVHISGGSVSVNFLGSQLFLGSLLGGAAGSSIAILQAAIAIDGGAGASHHANALASANIDPNLVQINGDVIVAAAAFDNSGHGATANANLFIHANEVHIGTAQGSANIIVAAIAQDSGLIRADVNAQANANIQANASATDAISINDVTVFAVANAEAANSTVVANAHLFMSANHGGVRVGSINVAATATAEDTNAKDAQANASAVVQANKEIVVNGDISVTASASATATNAGDANALAFLRLNAPNGFIDVEGNIFVAANAYENGHSSAVANATASIQADRVTLNGGVDVEAHANLANTAGTNALACANLDIDAFSGSININGPVTVNAQASGNGDGNASAYALAEIDANGGNVRVSGSIDVAANALLDGGQGDGAHANANLFIDAAFGGTEDIALTGNVTVSAQAKGNGTQGGGSGDSVTANAEAHIGGTSSQQHVDVDINGNISVTANADYSGGDGQNAWACANLEINATSGYVNVHGNVAVNAVALSNGTESAYANAQAEISAENGLGSNAGNVFVVGNISVLANAELDNSTGWGAHACANLNIIAHSGDVILTGNLNANAHALGNGSNATESVTANAVMQLETNSGNVSVNGFITVEALASYTGDDHENARACANLDVDASSGDLTINGGVKVVASAVDDGNGTAYANATAELAAENGGPASSAGDVKITGNISVKANAQQLSGSGGSAYARAELDIDADSGNVFINGRIAMTASAHDEGLGNASAFANVDIDACHTISVTGDIGAFANATHLGSNFGNASAEASVSANAGNNVALRGVVAIADADVPSTSAAGTANAFAQANIGITAGSNISVGPDGLFAHADASAFSGGQASANAQIAVDAGTNGVGNIFIRGNVITIAVALGSATGNIAHANAHMAAGGATSASIGAPSNFGNITVIGNIGAFAYADATNDRATASVEIFAHNNILIVGNDPIASAKVGPSGGTTFAFRQDHFTTNQFASGPGGNATADIDIRAGGFVGVFPASSLTHVEKLYSLPTDEPTLNSSGGLTIIPLTVDGQDCGVLGEAGADQNAVNKALSCHRKPINVSDLTDTGP